MAVELDTTGNGAIDIEKGGTNATSAVQALSNLGGQPLDSNLTALATGTYAQKRAIVGSAPKAIQNISALKTEIADFDKDIRYLVGISTYDDEGYGHFVWDSVSTLLSDDIDIVAVNGVTTGRWIRQSYTKDPLPIASESTSGIISLATPSEVVTGTDLSKAVTCAGITKKLATTEEAIAGLSILKILTPKVLSDFLADYITYDFVAGWFKIKNSIVIQWGQNVAASAENTWITHNFPIEFPTAALVIVGTGNDARVNLDPDIRMQILSKSQFRIWNTGVKGINVNWIAIGYEAIDDYSDIMLWSSFDGTIIGTTYTGASYDFTPNLSGVLTGYDALLVSIVGGVLKLSDGQNSAWTTDITPNTMTLFGGGRIGFWIKYSHPITPPNYTTFVHLKSSAGTFGIRIAGTDTVEPYYRLRFIITSNGVTVSNKLVDTGITNFKDVWMFCEVSWTNDTLSGYINGTQVLNQTSTALYSYTDATLSLISHGDTSNTLGASFNNLMISSDPTRDLYALANLTESPR